MKRASIACILTTVTSAAAAQSLPVTDDAVFTFNGQEITISRSSVLPDTSFDVVSRALSDCLQPCLSPMTAARNVATVGELDVIEFMSGPLENGDGLLVDARLPEDRSAGYIPASVNIPSATVAETNPFRDEILMALGAEQYQGIFNFEGAMDLVVYDDGPATQDAPVFIQDMLAAGYPANKIHYYRGGMQVWTTLGLTTTRAAQ
ncbi:Rhodanese-like domain protein [Pseudooctadecabacter jejudonensis]|uniref:Rhodanese-like domain protein n=1 Tax=Pseudooctadecabacter jejudonensis TaxID=1391910 RepID=A0A1Y5S0Y1_9RHOB|nr:Rhodanese-like domain protein [Pseudooctadecabacter jejudonensis]